MSQDGFGHGTDLDSYKATSHIRREECRFFQSIIAKIRGNYTSFVANDQILDIGCGPQSFFLALWADYLHVHVVGVDKDIPDLDTTSLNDKRQLIRGDLFTCTSIDTQLFNVIYASSAQTWMMAQYRPEVYWQRVSNLLKEGGYYCAHHPGEDDYFPDFNKIIIKALADLKSPLGEATAYFAARRQHVSAPASLADIRRDCANVGLKTLFLVKSLEWIPIPLDNDEYFLYWQSGGRKMLEQILSSAGNISYHQLSHQFKKVVGKLSTNSDYSRHLGITVFREQDEPYLVLPAWRFYHVAQKSRASFTSKRFHGLCLNHLEAPLVAHALARQGSFISDEDLLGRAAVLATPQDESRQVAYLAQVSISGDRARLVGAPWFGTEFAGANDWVNRGGKEFNLPTLTRAIALMEEEMNAGDTPPIGVIGMIFDNEKKSIDAISDLHKVVDETAVGPNGGPLRLVFNWQDDVIKNATISSSTGSRDLGWELIRKNDGGRPRLFALSDAAVNVVKQMIDTSLNKSYFQILRYFDWQTRVTAPYSQSFVVGTTVVRGIGGKIDTLHTLFGMAAQIREPDEESNRLQRVWHDTLLLHILVALSSRNMAKVMLEERERFKAMLNLVETPLRHLTHSIAEMQQDTQELRSVLMEPGEGIFEAHHLVSECFEQGTSVALNDHCILHIGHSPTVKKDAPFALRLQLAEVCRRILGVHRNVFESCGDELAIINQAQGFLRERRAQTSFKGLIRALERAMVDEINIDWIKTHFESEPKACEALSGLKSVLFSPFKVETRLWERRAVEVALLGEGSQAEVKGSGPKVIDYDQVDSPCTFQATLELIIRVARFVYSDTSEMSCEVITEESSGPSEIRIIQCVMKSDFHTVLKEVRSDGTKSPRRIKVIGAIERVLRSPRDWRIHATTSGDLTSPYVEFASKCLDIADGSKGTYWEIQPCDVDKGELLHLTRESTSFRLLAPFCSDPTLRFEWCVGQSSPQSVDDRVNRELLETPSPIFRVKLYLWDHDSSEYSPWRKTAQFVKERFGIHINDLGSDYRGLSKMEGGKASILLVHAHGDKLAHVLRELERLELLKDNSRVAVTTVSVGGEPSEIPVEFSAGSNVAQGSKRMRKDFCTREGIVELIGQIITTSNIAV